MLIASLENLDWDKQGGLLPAIAQDAVDGRVLMQAWMNPAALQRTLDTGEACFFSRSRKALWTKGETSGNRLDVVAIDTDCDRDCLLLRVTPRGPACHRGWDTCFDAEGQARPALAFLTCLEGIIAARERERPADSYTTRLFESGVRRIAQKVGEEGVETALAAASGSDSELLEESADLLYHLLVLLKSRELGLAQLVETLHRRHA